MEGYQQGVGVGRMGEKGIGNKKHKWQRRNRQGEVKNSIRNGEAKELICMTHGRELRWGNAGGKADAGQSGVKGRKKWENCNCIINKIYFKERVQQFYVSQCVLKI